jgi:Holliday junction resolvase
MDNYTLEVPTYLRRKKKTAVKERYLNNVNKGLDFEIQICDMLKSHNYEINPNGLYSGRADKGIDIVARRKKQILLIQCKNWKSDGRKIKQKDLKEFIGNCEIYKSKMNFDSDKSILNVFITSNYILDKGAEYFIKENEKILKYRVVEYQIKN